MTKTFQRTVRAFVSGLLGRKSIKGRCWIICSPLSSFLEVCGHRNRMVEGWVGKEHHFWIELENGEIVDPTAGQFKDVPKRILPRIYFGKKPHWYEEAAAATHP